MHSLRFPLPYVCLQHQAIPSLLIGTQEISGRRNNKVMVFLQSAFISPFPVEFLMMEQAQTFRLPQARTELSLLEPPKDSLWAIEVPHHHSIATKRLCDIGDFQCQLSFFKVPVRFISMVSICDSGQVSSVNICSN